MTNDDCPICMEVVHSDINCVITECKHLFHTKCLLTNISRNGFGCPYCRTVMIDQPILNGDDEDGPLNEDDAEDWNSDEDSHDSSSDEDEPEAIREPINHVQIASVIERENIASRDSHVPSPQEIASLLEQSGYSLIDFVRIVLWDEHPEYDNILTNRISRSTARNVFYFIRGLLREHQGRIEPTPASINLPDEEEEELTEPPLDHSWLTAPMAPFDDTGFFFMGSTSSIYDDDYNAPDTSVDLD